MKKIFFLDAHALIYRAHFAFIKRPLINSKGVDTSAITGFINTLWDILEKENPTHIGVAFDLKGPTFRHEMFEAYKANRDAQPESISIAIPYIYKVLEGFGIPIVTKEGFEADDVIGTLARKAEAAQFDEIYMMTPDKDYAQLVSDHIFLYKPSKFGKPAEKLGKAEILEKWGIQQVEQVIDMLGLQGDSVDNIPGVRGIGPKTARKLLQKFDSIEAIYENIDKITGRQQKALIEHKEEALLSKKLARIETEVPVTFDPVAFERSALDKEALRTLFKELELKSIMRRILGEDAIDENQQRDLFGSVVASKPERRVAAPKVALTDKNIENVPHDYQVVDTEAGYASLVKTLMGQDAFAFDTETTGLEAHSKALVGLSFAVTPHEAYYVPLYPQDAEKTQAVLAYFKPVFEQEGVAKIGQNLKFDMLMLRWAGIEVVGPYWDTMIMHYVLEPDKKHNLNYLSETYLGYTPVPIESLIGKKGKHQLKMQDLPIEKIAPYAAEDADVTLQLYHTLLPLLEAETSLKALYETVEAPLIPVLVEMEYQGVHVDKAMLASYSETLSAEIETLKKNIFEQAGVKEVNLDSPKQIGEMLFDKMGLPYKGRKTKTGQYSTNESKLRELAEEHDIVKQILEYRGLTKLKSTYVDALPRLIHKESGRIHTSFTQALTATGRLSSQNPNLQNIPIRTERGRRIRQAFVPRDTSHVLFAADYSQIELRLIAELSQDKAMLEAFKSGQDIHRATAARIYGVSLEEVSPKQRYNAKTVNFSIIYGAGATNLAKNLEIKRAEAKTLIDQYYAQYNGLKVYEEEMVRLAREQGYVETIRGRRRYLRDINSRNGMMRSHAERNAVNTPIQGSAADMIKLAMIHIHKALREEGFEAKMILQVHDELIFDVPKQELERLMPRVEQLMQEALTGLEVPIVVGMDSGQNWLEAH